MPRKEWTCKLAVCQATSRAPDRIRPGNQLPAGLAKEFWNSAHQKKQSAAARAQELWLSSDSTVTSEYCAATFDASFGLGFDMLEALQSQAWVPAPPASQPGSRPRTPIGSRLRKPAAGDEPAASSLPACQREQRAHHRLAMRTGLGKLATIAWDVEQAARQDGVADVALEAESAAAVDASLTPRASGSSQCKAQPSAGEEDNWRQLLLAEGRLSDSGPASGRRPTEGCQNKSCKSCGAALPPYPPEGCLNVSCKSCKPTSQRLRPSPRALAAAAELAALMQAKAKCSRCRVRPCPAHKRLSQIMSVDARG